MELSITTILFLGAAQGVLLSLVLLTNRRGNRSANRILAATLLLVSTDIFLHTLPHTEYPYSHPHHAELIFLLFLLITPLVYLYVQALTRNDFRFGLQTCRHFLPFAIFGLISICPEVF